MPTVILRRRRRWVRLVVVGVVVVALAIVWMTRPRGAAGGSPGGYSSATAVALPCQIVEHSVEGAAAQAAAGLHALAVANLGRVDATPEHAAEVEKTLARWVVPEQRPGVRAYLSRYPMALVSITSHVDGWEPLSFTPAEAIVRIRITDTGTTSIGTTKTASAVFDVTLMWNPLEETWRLESWPRVDGQNLAAELAAAGKAMPCA